MSADRHEVASESGSETEVQRPRRRAARWIVDEATSRSAGVWFGLASLLLAATGGAITIYDRFMSGEETALPDAPQQPVMTLVGSGCTADATRMDVALPLLRGVGAQADEFGYSTDEPFNAEVLRIVNAQLDPLVQPDGVRLDDWVNEGAIGTLGYACDAFDAPGFPAGRGPIIEHRVMFLSPQLVSVVVEATHFGASAYTYSEGIIFDARSQRLINAEDVFRPDIDWPYEIGRVLCEDLRRSDELATCGLADSLRQPGRISTDGTGIVFLFDDCEVMMCAAGPPSVSVPWNRLTYLLREDDPLRPLLRER